MSHVVAGGCLQSNSRLWPIWPRHSVTAARIQMRDRNIPPQPAPFADELIDNPDIPIDGAAESGCALCAMV